MAAAYVLPICARKGPSFKGLLSQDLSRERAVYEWSNW
ncbi:hypothetical protein COLO4_08792 [Corchorus olitorius]|uniref:Uncharacterized protein n=1 Tax=Corchorus olitorius TaxID=93759 RepID=A0A1R3KER5_9ROSI|nr:hypothetical protein COLO4_08792 [Corchorus olitorius]